MLYSILLCMLVLVAAKVASAVHKAGRFRGVPGFFGCAFWPGGRVPVESVRFNFQPVHVWLDKGRAYRKFGMTAYVIKSLWSGNSTVVISDVEGVKQMTQKPGLFIKKTVNYQAISFYGPGLLSTNGDVWKRHRQVAGPAFGIGFDKAMWTETVQVLDGWFERLPAPNQAGQHVVDVSVSFHETALMIISAAGFGRTIPWPDQEEDLPAHHSLTWLESLKGMGNNLLFRGTLPNWLFWFPIASLRRIDEYFTEFESHLLEMIDERRAMGHQGLEMNDLFSRLIRASDAEAGTAKLDKQELLSDIHIFLVAGYETTSHALMAAFMLLVLYPDYQDAIADEAKAALGEDGEVPTYDAFAKLRLTTAFFMETLRLLPSVNSIPKLVARDSSVLVHTVPTKLGQEPVPVTIPLPAGTNVRFDVTAMALDPAQWGEDVLEFKPSRFFDTDDYKWPRDAFMTFNAGQRICIGRQAAIVEATAFIASTVAKFRVEAPAGEAEGWKLRAGESEMDRRQRIYKPIHNITLTPLSPLNIALVPRV